MVIALGVISRVLRFENVILSKYLGDALYAILFYLLISLTGSTLRVIPKATLVFIFMMALELFQLTRIPLTMSQNENGFVRIIAVLLGTAFSWLDVLAYVVGIVIVASADKLIVENRKGE
jgi:hypothetical protein